MPPAVVGKYMNTQKKIKYNFIIGVASELLSIVLGILVPRFILTSYGSEVNGLLSSVTQIYSYIGLLEAGIGVATVQALYNTVGCQNRQQTNAVLAATNKFYHRTGLLYLLAILAFSVIYPLLVSSEIPALTVVLVIVLNGLGSVISYFFQGKYFLLLQAEGKNYVKTSLNMATNVFKNVAKIAMMGAGCDVVVVQMIGMIISLIQMAFITFYIKKNYSWIDLTVKPDYESIAQSKNVLVHQISGLIYNNTDAITLSVFCGLKAVSVYSMYTMLFGMVSMALNTISSSFIFSLGQMFHNDRQRFMKYFDVYETYYMTIVFALYSIANFFILPFLKLYTAGVTDVNYLDTKLPLLFITTYLLSCGRSATNQVINFAGHFKKTQNRAMAEAAINLIVSVVAVQFLGIYGVLIGTIAALLYRSNDIILYANKIILKRSAWITYKRWLINLITFGVVLFINKHITLDIQSYGELFVLCVPYSLACLIVFIAIISISEKESAMLVWKMTIGRFIRNKG